MNELYDFIAAVSCRVIDLATSMVRMPGTRVVSNEGARLEHRQSVDTDRSPNLIIMNRVAKISKAKLGAQPASLARPVGSVSRTDPKRCGSSACSPRVQIYSPPSLTAACTPSRDWLPPRYGPALSVGRDQSLQIRRAPS